MYFPQRLMGLLANFKPMEDNDRIDGLRIKR